MNKIAVIVILKTNPFKRLRVAMNLNVCATFELMIRQPCIVFKANFSIILLPFVCNKLPNIHIT